MVVHVRRSAGLVLEIRLRSNATVAELKGRVQSAWGAPPDQQRLFYRNTPLDDDNRTLALYNITDGASLTMW